MWKVFSHIDDSKVERTFLPNEYMNYYDDALIECLVHSSMNIN